MSSPRSSACHPLAKEVCLHHYSPALPSPTHLKEMFENSFIPVILGIGRALSWGAGRRSANVFKLEKKQVCGFCAWALKRVRERLDGAATWFGWEIRNKLKCSSAPSWRRSCSEKWGLYWGNYLKIEGRVHYQFLEPSSSPTTAAL